MKASRHQRDPWEVEGDTPPAWQAKIAARAQALGQPVTTNARWGLFALQTLLADLRAIPQSNFIRYIALYGPLANGVETDEIALATVLTGTTPAPIHADIWDRLSDLFRAVERAYAIRVDCLLVMEDEIADPDKRPAQFAAIEQDHVIVWP